MQRTFIRTAAAALLCAGASAACGGGGSSVGGITPPGGVTTTPASTPTPTPTPTPPSTTQSTGTAPITSAATSAPIPSAGGYSGTLQFPSSNASGTVTLSLTTSTVAPPDLAPLARKNGDRRATLPTGSAALLYESLTSPVTITFSATPQIDVTLPAAVSTAGVQFFIAVYDPAVKAWQEPVAGPATVSGQNITFASASTAFTLQAGMTYTLALYESPTVQTTPTPTPAATPTPTATPSYSLTAAPASLSFNDGLGSTYAQYFQVTNGTGPYAASGYDTSVVSVQVSAYDAASFEVVPLAAGTTSITVTDADGATMSVPITVTTISGGIQ